MKIDLKWDKPIRLRDKSSKMNLIYACRDSDLKRIPDDAGIYVLHVGLASRSRLCILANRLH